MWASVVCVVGGAAASIAGVASDVVGEWWAVIPGAASGGLVGGLLVWIARRATRNQPSASAVAARQSNVCTSVDDTGATASAESMVPATIESESSEIWRVGAENLFATLLVSIENRLDVDVCIRSSELRLVLKGGSRLDVPFVGFRHEGAEDTPAAMDSNSIRVPARAALRGWFQHSHKGTVRITGVESFEFRIQAIGEPLEVHRFEPYSWDEVRQGQSRIVMLPSGSDT